ncbi:hypothetical protein [Constantimarinum furrinae]|uniref:Uncharacterized protein n=1 Tax=Constantimarinum furrinae TaxID=2562285 RepID=A0A7G8PU28_9FLAO|nr:hypothetical protein [Constantimarinum furrinae]QNJ97844.1 hypothetical protein ALE3EI_1279 [Constantimarinum furrinae]
MKLKNIVLVVLITGTLLPVVAQDGIQNRRFINEVYQIDEYIKRLDQGVNYADTDSYTGTPYNHPSYLPGNVYKNNGLLATDVALRYNAMADEIEIKESLTTSDDDAKVLTKSPDIYVKINTDIYVFVPYKGGIEGGGYFHVLYEGEKYDLFKKPSKKFTPEKKATTSITRDTPAKFSDRPVYYIVTKEGKFYELPASKSKKLKVFAENRNAVKDYVSSNGLDLNNENDLIRVIKYYDGIGK